MADESMRAQMKQMLALAAAMFDESCAITAGVDEQMESVHAQLRDLLERIDTARRLAAAAVGHDEGELPAAGQRMSVAYLAALRELLEMVQAFLSAKGKLGPIAASLTEAAQQARLYAARV